MNVFYKILIVDDESSIRNGLLNFIDWNKNGFNIIGEAANGKEALKKIEELSPQIVITDIVMPILDGVQLSKIIQSNYPDIKIVILSSHSDFEYVKKTFQSGAVDYILKPTLNPTELLNVLKKLSADFDTTHTFLTIENKIESMISQYLSGYTDHIDPSLMDNYFRDSLFCLLTIDLKLYANPANIKTFVQSELIEILVDYQPILFTTNQNVLCLIFNYGISYKKICSTIQMSLNNIRIIEPTTFFVLSKEFSNINEIKPVYDNLVHESKNKRFFFKEAALITQEQLFIPKAVQSFDTKKYFIHLVNQNFIEVLENIKHRLQKMIAQKVNENELKRFANSVFYDLFSAIEESNFPFENLQQKRMILLTNMNSCIYLEDFSTLTHAFIDELKEKLTAYYAQSNGDLISIILQYIKEHAAEKITLNDIALKFHFNYHYLSSYFSSHFNETFPDYLNRIRIEQSVKLLKNSTMSISEVAESCGYSDISYFSKVFKKIIGKTPTQFRREA
ncbi:response regulator [Carnobacterium sp.]|uniref:response regulator transcription factor n=1 Tax=Carnobacterium sp. TaxID=48221 RepID=UPI0028AD8ABC|nr:response regulator [Carnobacterium sp.]